jgi:hypothetical protein
MTFSLDALAQQLRDAERGQAHLAAHYPPAMGHVVLNVQALDGVGGVGVVDAQFPRTGLRSDDDFFS